MPSANWLWSSTIKSKLTGSPSRPKPAMRSDSGVTASTVPLKTGEMGAAALSAGASVSPWAPSTFPSGLAWTWAGVSP